MTWRIRGLALNGPHAVAEVALVARRMRQTLVEVVDSERGASMYTMDWLEDRVRAHLDPARIVGDVFLAELTDESSPERVIGHTIVRVETDEAGRRFGLFSTTYVDPAGRRRGVASGLLQHGEQWMRGHQLPEAVTYTATDNHKLIGLYEKRGYRLTDRYAEPDGGMVRLARPLEA